MLNTVNRKLKRFIVRQQKRKPVVHISDTTLRDGAQMPGIRLTTKDRVDIAAALAAAGVHSIDCGFPASGPREIESIQAVTHRVKGPVLSALSRTLNSDIDLAAEALSDVPVTKRGITLFIGTSPLHRAHKHEMGETEIIRTACKAIEYAAKQFQIISFGAEDASRTEPDFLHEIYDATIGAGAVSIGFTDTVGILTPTKAATAVRKIQDNVPGAADALLAVHFHNDLGLATANALACVKEGANIIQGTINGIGERAGNTALEEVVMVLSLHHDEFGKRVNVDPTTLAELSELVADRTGIIPAANKPVVGLNMFRTSAGIHQDGLLQHPDTYLPFRPETIGAEAVRLLLDHNSGKQAVRHHLEAAGVEATDEHVALMLSFLKDESLTEEERAEVQDSINRLRPHLANADSEDESYANTNRHRSAV
jgi:2-isopropylmalate synthase